MPPSQKLSPNTFQDLLTSFVREICADRKWDFNNNAYRGWAFQMWFAELLLKYDQEIETPLEEAVLFSKDGGIDIFLEDTVRKHAYLVQAKWMSLNEKKPIVEGEMTDFFGRHVVLQDRNWINKHLSEPAIEALSSYGERVKDGFSFTYYFVATGVASPRVRDLFAAIQDKYTASDDNVQCRLLDMSNLKEFYQLAQSADLPLPEQVRIHLPTGRYFVKEKPHRTAVAVLKGNELINLYKKERDSLFAYNIRGFLGGRGINNDIVETAQKAPGDFYYFNNGVSAICTSFEIDADNVLIARDFQIINGAQTVGALSRAGMNPDVEVLVRITEGESVKTEKGFNADIIRFNNTQNVIKVSDFRANDKIQIWLEKAFNEHKPRGCLDTRVSYMRKRTGRNKKPGEYLVRLEDFVKIRFTWRKEPTRAIADPKSLWTASSEGGVYEDAIGVDDEIVDFYANEQMNDCILAVAIYRAIEEASVALAKESKEFRFFRRLRYFGLGLAAVFVRHGVAAGKIDPSKLLTETAYFRKHFDTFWEKAKDVLIDIYEDEVGAEKISLFALARSSERWAALLKKYERKLQAGK